MERKNIGGKVKMGGTVQTLQEEKVQALPKQSMVNNYDFVVFKYENDCTIFHNYFHLCY